MPCPFCWLASYSGCYKVEIYSLWTNPWALFVQLSRKYCSFSLLDSCYTSYSIKLSAWIRTSWSVVFHLEKSINTINACLFFFPVFSLLDNLSSIIYWGKINVPKQIFPKNPAFPFHAAQQWCLLSSPAFVGAKFPKRGGWPKCVKLPSGLHLNLFYSTFWRGV